MGWPMLVLVLVGRITLGTLLSAVLSVIGIGVAWGMFVFSGAVAHSTLLTLFMVGAGVGAAVGSFGAWLKIDRVPGSSILFGKMIVLLLAGIGGAWGSYQFGTNQEVECCVGSAITPITYTALGATAATNAAALVMGVASDIKVRGGWARFRTAAGGSTVGAKREAGRLRH
jgi:hypothetical protein